MDAMYHSLGGDGYISPGRRSYHPSTDLRDNKHQHRLARCSLAALTFLLLAAALLTAALFAPRPLSSEPSGSGSSASYYQPVGQQQLSFAFNHSVSLSNGNYYPLSVQSALLTFTLPPLPPIAAERYSPPLPQFCSTPHILGTHHAPSSTVAALQTSNWRASGLVVATGSGTAELCLREWCTRRGAYELWMDALLRVSYLQMQAALVTDTVTVSVQCPSSRPPQATEAPDVPAGR